VTSSVITFDELEHEHEHLKQAAASGPVFVVESGRPDLVVLSFENYERLRSKGPTLGEALSMPFGTPDEVLNFEFPTLGGNMGLKSVDLS
jgi:prevent-host-death family protein